MTMSTSSVASNVIRGVAIETEYSGVTFRSRLEARWAIFFAHLGLRWEYEPEAFALPEGFSAKAYLPDFRVWLEKGRKPWWFEIKPSEPDYDSEEMRKLEHVPGNRCLLWGDPTYNANQQGYWWALWDELDGTYRHAGTYRDASYAFCVCRYCGAIGFEFDGRSARMQCCEANKSSGEEKAYTSDHPRITGAAAVAKGFRFWSPHARARS